MWLGVQKWNHNSTKRGIGENPKPTIPILLENSYKVMWWWVWLVSL